MSYRVPGPRLVRQMYPRYLVQAARFLSGAGAGFITDQTLIVDGGRIFA